MNLIFSSMNLPVEDQSRICSGFVIVPQDQSLIYSGLISTTVDLVIFAYLNFAYFIILLFYFSDAIIIKKFMRFLNSRICTPEICEN